MQTRLQGLIEAGHVWVEDGVIVGRAADGVTVELGYTWEGPEAIERYLADHPTPDTW